MSSKTSRTFLMVALFASVSVASVAPVIPPEQMPPPIIVPIPDLPAPPPSFVPNILPPLTKDQLDRLPISGALYYQLLRSLNLEQKLETSSPVSIGGRQRSTRQGKERFGITPLASVETSFQATHDAQDDVESSIVSFTRNSVDYTVTAYMQLQPDLVNYRINFTTRNSSGGIANGQLNVPAGWVSSYDPVVAANVYWGGVGPGRVYCVGILNSGGQAPATALAVWLSDTNGMSFVGPAIVHEQAGGTSLVLDKPSIDVSWHSGTLGNVYIAYMRINRAEPIHEMRLARSTNGGTNYEFNFIAIDNVHAPWINVSPSTGNLYTWWTNNDLPDIRMGYSTDLGLTWTHEIVSGGNMIVPDRTEPNRRECSVSA